MDIFIEIAKTSGPVGVAIIVLYFIVKEFLKSMKEQRAEFTTVINNHLNDHSKALREMRDSNVKMITVIEQLIKWLERNGKK